MKANKEKSIEGRLKIECINNHTVQIELDNLSIDFLVETLLELKTSREFIILILILIQGIRVVL